jgi:hypothetical protein
MFIRCVEDATIDSLPIPEDARERLRDPPEAPPELSRDTMYSLQQFLATLNAADGVYEKVRQNAMKDAALDGKERDLLSLHEIEKLLAELTGVVPIINDMCPKGHCGFTGPFADMEQCPYCDEDRYEWVEVTTSRGTRKKERRPRKVFWTIPLGPALQALFRSPEAAEKARYREEATARMQAEVDEHGNVENYRDYIDGTLYRELLRLGIIRPEDIVVMWSGDSCQLLKLKQSDCFIYIWVLMDISTDFRFKKRYILPGGFVPGPEHIGNHASFLCPGLQCANAVMKEGLGIWNAASLRRYNSYPFCIFETADGIGLEAINGVNGHRGYMGCRLFCPHRSRRRQGDSHYYPACNCASGPVVEGSDHPDIDPAHLPPASVEDYEARLTHLLTARNASQYEKLRRETGISVPTIFLGLERMTPFPLCLTSDIMHLDGSNIPELRFGLWRGTLKERASSDPPKDWPWRVLVDDVWETFGQRLEDAKRYLPGSFERAPRNIAKKINSGYKAWEYIMALYGCAPGYLMDVLPEPYYLQFVKEVFAVRRKGSRVIPVNQVKDLHVAAVLAHREFEEHYYQRRPERISFCRQSLHNNLHNAPEILRVGPLALLAQWLMERTIGDLVRQIRNFQSDRMYANLAHIGTRQVQLNALFYMFPELSPEELVVSSTDIDLGGGFYLLSRGKEQKPSPVTQAEREVILAWLQDHSLGDVFEEQQLVQVLRWPRLRLPNGQIVRSLWKEDQSDPQKVRMARNIKVSCTARVHHVRALKEKLAVPFFTRKCAATWHAHCRSAILLPCSLATG